jgi:1-acyl-sn-glycerol-3-phosphate acyltransferase
VEVPEEPPSLGADYDTDWARSPVARAAREVIAEGPMRVIVRGLADPEISGTDRLDDWRRAAGRDGDDDAPPLIFAPNHHSHLDTALMVRAVPWTWRRKLVVAAAADYFFDKRWKATLAALSLNAVPIERESTGRRSADLVRELVADGWSLVIYPEGGRSPDGWGQEFKGGAAYVSARTGAPVVPVFIDGTGAIYGKGMPRPKPGRTRVVFGAPMRPLDGESTRRFNSRIHAAVTTLADESTTDWWTARRRAAAGTSPTLGGPAYTGWRRQWDLSKRRRQGIAGWRRPPTRTWPDLG